MNNISENPYPLQNNWDNNLGSFKTLPPEIFVEITSFLKKEEVCRLEQTSKEFRRMTHFFWKQVKKKERINFNWHCCDGLPNRDKIEYIINKTFLRIHHRNFKLNSDLGSRFPFIAAYYFSLKMQSMKDEIKKCKDGKEKLEKNYANGIEILKKVRSSLNSGLNSGGERLLQVLFQSRNLTRNSGEITNFNTKILPIIKDLHHKNGITSTVYFILSALNNFNFNKDEPPPGSKRKRTVDNYNIFKNTLIELETLAIDANNKKDFRPLQCYLDRYDLLTLPAFDPQSFLMNKEDHILPPIIDRYITTKYELFIIYDTIIGNFLYLQDLTMFDEAILDKALFEYGDQIPIYLLRIAVRIKVYLKKFDEAEILINKLLLYRSSEADLVLSLLIKYELNKFEECDNLFNTIRRDNTAFSLLKIGAISKRNLKKFKEAEEIFDSISKQGDCPDIDLDAGLVKYYLQKFQEANSYFNSLLKYTNPATLSNDDLSIIILNKIIIKDFQGALYLCQYIPKSLSFYILDGIIKCNLNNFKEADQAFNIVIDNMQDNNEFFKLWTYSYAALVKFKLDELELAEKYYTLAISIIEELYQDGASYIKAFPDFFNYQRAAYVKKLLNKLDDADQLYDKARRFEEIPPSVFAEAMQVKVSLGKVDETKKITQDYILDYLPKNLKELALQINIFD